MRKIILSILLFLLFTAHTFAFDVPKLNMKITVPDGYSISDDLEENEYVCFISNDKKQYISVRMIPNTNTYSLKEFSDKEIEKIAKDVNKTTQGSETEIYKTDNITFFKVRNADRDIYYTFANGQCISIASIDMYGNSPNDISKVIDAVKIKDNYKPMPFDLYLLIIIGGVIISVVLAVYAVLFYRKMWKNISNA